MSHVPPAPISDGDAAERARLHEALREAWAGAKSEGSISGEELLRDLAVEDE
ncbi:MAG: hypothetical protein ABJE95_11665 [Byssovorax sp.]